VAEAKFQTRFFGSIYIVWVGISRSLMDAVIFTNLEDRKSLKTELTTNNWKIFSTDVLESILGMLYDCFILCKIIHDIIKVVTTQTFKNRSIY